MEILGYSERGMINSLMYNIGEDKELLKSFIKLISLPESIDIEDVDDFEIIIEQSLSQFGDADLIIIAHCNNNKKKVLFFEAKVKTTQGNWIIGDQFAKYNVNNEKKGYYKGYSSNLFYQLYLKKLLIDNHSSIVNDGIVEDKLEKKRSIGGNVIVKNAAKMIGEGTSYYYIGIIPTMDDDIKAFLNNKDYKEELYFLSWKTIKDFCEKEKLQKVLKVFEYNDGQIY